MSKTKGAPAFRLSSDPLAVPVRQAGGAAADVKITFDVGACLELDTPSLYRAVLGADLLTRFRRGLRALRESDQTFFQTYPDGERVKLTEADGETPATYRRFTAAEQDAYDAARDAQEQDVDRLTAEAATTNREVYLAVIAHTVITVEGADVDASPDPATPADWDAWPTSLLKWVAEEGVTAAKESVRSKKS